MNSFLGEVAQELYSQYGDKLSRLNLIFPSRRARLFFVDALAQVTQRPVWQPHWMSIDDIMSSVAGMIVGDKIRLIAELYRIYSQYHDDSFDRFYFWGEILLSDFEMIDKYLIDADMLFSNIHDIKELEADVSYLTPEQLKIIESFWHNIGEGDSLSEEKQRFLKIWRSLAPIYNQYKARLKELGIAYTGMIHRTAVERMNQGEGEGEEFFDTSRQYILVGFNALSECEKRLFAELKNRGLAQIYWDYDDYYTSHQEQEAGLFIRENITRFPQSAAISHNNFAREKSVEVISAASNILQCKYVANIVEQLQNSGETIDKDTAIVLTNENMLLPLLYSLPQSVGKVNVTMGYPLRETLAYSFVERLIELQHHSRKGRSGAQFYHTDVVGLLSHPYLSASKEPIIEEITTRRMIYIDESYLREKPLWAEIFSHKEGWQQISQYLESVISHIISQSYKGDDAAQRDEFLTTQAQHITTLRNSIEACEIEISQSVYVSLLRAHLQKLRVPFEGEPLEGIQVMGILETRNLDFKNVILLSMNDDNFPGNQLSQPSYVPYNLRAAYGLPTPEHHEGVYAYYFYRLLQRAQRVWLLYSSHADEKSNGEPSRYIHQLEYESPFTLQRTAVGVDVNMVETQTIEVKKEGRVAERLSRFTDSENPITLSPTALYRYIACPLKFYFHSIAGIRRDDELTERVDNSMFGTILHAAMQELYAPLVGVAHIEAPLRNAILQVEQIVDRAINTLYLKREGCTTEEYSGEVLLIKEIVCKYIREGVVAHDLRDTAFIVEGVEMPIECDFDIDDKQRVRFYGIADRVDRLLDGTLRIVDYKSGAAHLEFKGIESLFTGDGRERMSNIIQTLLYSMMFTRSRKEARVMPTLYYMRSINSPNYSPKLIEYSDKQRREVLSYSDYNAEFEEHLRSTLSEIFDIQTPFRQCEDAKNTCSYCDYKDICRR